VIRYSTVVQYNVVAGCCFLLLVPGVIVVAAAAFCCCCFSTGLFAIFIPVFYFSAFQCFLPQKH